MATQSATRLGPIEYLAFTIPPALFLTLLLIYLIWPDFYLKYILEHGERETQFVEILTNLAAGAAGLILICCGISHWRMLRRQGGPFLPGGVVFVMLAGLAAIFFLGEELSWGQTLFQWKTPEQIKAVSRETNLHNGIFGNLVRFGANVFVLGMFIGLPLLWTQRRRFRLPADWEYGIAEWPVVACVVLATLVRNIKVGFMLVVPDAATRDASPFWNDYLGEINEQQELFVAIAIAIYAIYRWRKRRDAIDDSQPF